MCADTAMNTVNAFEGQLNHPKEYSLVCRAKEALDLELTCHTFRTCLWRIKGPEGRLDRTPWCFEPHWGVERDVGGNCTTEKVEAAN